VDEDSLRWAAELETEREKTTTTTTTITSFHKQTYYLNFVATNCKILCSR
jgi:hypothetical protein